MLIEIKHVRQIPNEPTRRWFTSVEQDLLVWYDAQQQIVGWQFCYDKSHTERALSWKRDIGYSHMVVDDGEHAGAMHYKSTPVLHADKVLDQAYVLALFLSNKKNLPLDILRLIEQQITDFPNLS